MRLREISMQAALILLVIVLLVSGGCQPRAMPEPAGAATGSLIVVGPAYLNGGLTMDTNKFTVTDGTGAVASAGPVASTQTKTSQSTENTGVSSTLTTDSTYIGGTDVTYSGGIGSSGLKAVTTYKGSNGAVTNIYSSVTTTNTMSAAGAGVMAVKGVSTNTAAVTDGSIYGAQFIAKHNHATNKMANEAALIGVEGWAYDSGAAPAGTMIGGNFGYHNEGTTAKDAGAVHRGVQIFLDDAAGAQTASENTGLAIWNMAGTQDEAIKLVKSDGGFTKDVVLQNGETIDNATNGTIALTGAASVTGLANLDGGIAVDTDNFVVSGTSGAVETQSTVGTAQTLTSQTTENTGFSAQLTTDTTHIGGTNVTYSGGYGSSGVKSAVVYSGSNGAVTNIYSSVTTTNTMSADGAGVMAVKGVATNTGSVTDGNVYGAQFIAKHNHATNKMANAAPLIGLEGWAYDSGAAPAGTVIGANVGYHNEGTTAKDAGAVYRGLQVFLDDAAGAAVAEENSGVVVWNMAGTQDQAIKMVKSDGGFTDDIVFQNGETLDNATDHYLTTDAQLVLSGTADADAANYDNMILVEHDLKGLATKDRVYGLTIEMTRPSGFNTTDGDHDDAGIKVRMVNKATANTTGTTLRGIDVNVKNDNPGGVITNLSGATFTAQTDSSAGPTSTAYAVQGQITANDQINDSLIVADFRNFRQAATEPTIEYGVQIRNGNTSGTGIDRGLSFKSEASTVGAFGYILDMNDAEASTADIRLSQGETIDNLTDGTITLGGSTVTGGTTTYTPQSAVTVTPDSTIAITSAVVPLTAAGTVGTATITGCNTAGRVSMLYNIANQQITITDTATIMLSGNAVLGQYDTLTLLGDGTNCLQLSKADN